MDGIWDCNLARQDYGCSGTAASGDELSIGREYFRIVITILIMIIITMISIVIITINIIIIISTIITIAIILLLFYMAKLASCPRFARRPGEDPRTPPARPLRCADALGCGRGGL